MPETTKPVVLTDAEKAAHRAEMGRIRALTGSELAQEVLEIIEDNRDRWYQGAWRTDYVNGRALAPCDGAPETTYEAWAEDPLSPECKTSFCFAGWVGAVKGVKWAKGDQENVALPELCDCPGLCCVNSEHQIGIDTFAERALGLGGGDGNRLFNGDNDIHDLRSMVDLIVRDGTLDAFDTEDEDDDDDGE